MKVSLIFFILVLLFSRCISDENDVKIDLNSVISEDFKPEANLEFAKGDIDHLIQSLNKDQYFQEILQEFTDSHENVFNKMFDERNKYVIANRSMPDHDVIMEKVKSDTVYKIRHENSMTFFKYIHSITKNMDSDTKKDFFKKLYKNHIKPQIEYPTVMLRPEDLE